MNWLGMKTKTPLLLLVLMLLSVSVNAQQYVKEDEEKKEKKNKDFWDKVYVGGNVGLQFGSSTFLAISPLVGYNFTKKLSAGAGVTYQYYHYKDAFYDIETHVYGGRIFARYMITEYLFAYTEYEHLNLEAFDFSPRRRVDVGSLLGGAGYIQRMTDNIALQAMLLYNFTQSYYTPYQNPIIRIGITVGL